MISLRTRIAIAAVTAVLAPAATAVAAHGPPPPAPTAADLGSPGAAPPVIIEQPAAPAAPTGSSVTPKADPVPSAPAAQASAAQAPPPQAPPPGTAPVTGSARPTDAASLTVSAPPTGAGPGGFSGPRPGSTLSRPHCKRTAHRGHTHCRKRPAHCTKSGHRRYRNCKGRTKRATASSWYDDVGLEAGRYVLGTTNCWLGLEQTGVESPVVRGIDRTAGEDSERFWFRNSYFVWNGQEWAFSSSSAWHTGLGSDWRGVQMWWNHSDGSRLLPSVIPASSFPGQYVAVTQRLVYQNPTTGQIDHDTHRLTAHEDWMGDRVNYCTF